MDSLPAGFELEQPQTQAPVPEQASTELPPGFEPEGNKYDTLGQQALTVAEGLGKGFAGPVSTILETGISKLGQGIPAIASELTPEKQAEREEANPITHGISEAVGFGLGAVTGTGEAAALTKIGEAAARAIPVATKIGGAAIKGAAEMAALQTGDEISKTINGEIEQDPAKSLGTAAINIGLSGILGGAGGAVLGSIPSLWKTTNEARADGVLGLIKNKMDGVGLPVDTDINNFLKTAEKDGIKIPEEIKAGLSNSPAAQNIFKTLREAGNSSSEALVGTIEQTKEVAQNQISKILGENGPSAFEAGEVAKKSLLDKAEELNTAVRSKYDAVGDTTSISLPDKYRLKFYDQLIEAGQNFGAAGSPSQNLFKTYAERALSQDTIGQLDKLNTEIGSELSVAWRAGDNEKYKALATIRDSIREFQDQQIGKTISETVVPSVFTSEHEKIWGSETKMLAEKDNIISEAVAQRKEARKAYSSFMDKLSEMASLGKAGKIRNYSQFEDAIQNVPSAKLADRLFDKKNIEALRSIKNEYPEIFDKIVQQQKSDILESATKQGILNHNTAMSKVNSLPKEIRNLLFNKEELETIEGAHAAIRQLNERFNPSGTAGTLAKALGHVPAAAGALISMATGHGMAGGFIAGELTQILGKSAPNAVKLGLLKFLGSDAPIHSGALKSTVDFANAAYRGQSTLVNSIKSMFEAGKVLPAHLLPTAESREKLQKSLDHVSNPDNMIKVGGSIGHYLPTHAQAAGTLATTAQTYLNSLKPKAAHTGMLDSPLPIDKAAQAKYDRQLDIAQQPLLVLEHAKKGTIQQQDIMTLNTLYPGLKNKIVSQLSQEMVKAQSEGKAIPYSQRLGMSKLMGIPVDSTMTPASMQAIIMSSKNTPQSPQQGTPKKATAAGAKASEKMNSLYETPLQARAAHKRE